MYRFIWINKTISLSFFWKQHCPCQHVSQWALQHYGVLYVVSLCPAWRGCRNPAFRCTISGGDEINRCFRNLFNLIRSYMAVGFHRWRNTLFLGGNQQPSVSNWQLLLMGFESKPQRRWGSISKARLLGHGGNFRICFSELPMNSVRLFMMPYMFATFLPLRRRLMLSNELTKLWSRHHTSS